LADRKAEPSSSRFNGQIAGDKVETNLAVAEGCLQANNDDYLNHHVG